MEVDNGIGASMANAMTGMSRAEQQVSSASAEIAREPVRRQEREEQLRQQDLEQQGVEQSVTARQQDARVEQSQQAVAQPQVSQSQQDAQVSVNSQLIGLVEGERAFAANVRSIEATQAMFDSLIGPGDTPSTNQASS